VAANETAAAPVRLARSALRGILARCRTRVPSRQARYSSRGPPSKVRQSECQATGFFTRQERWAAGPTSAASGQWRAATAGSCLLGRKRSYKNRGRRVATYAAGLVRPHWSAWPCRPARPLGLVVASVRNASLATQHTLILLLASIALYNFYRGCGAHYHYC
jgi:hypothetical protein